MFDKDRENKQLYHFFDPAAIDELGKQFVEKDLELLQAEQDTHTLGQQVVDIDLRLLQGGL